VTVNSQTGEIRANGNILMIRDGTRWEGQELVYNYKTREGTFGKSFMYFEPAYITAEKTERISTNVFLMHDAMITTCSGENPTIYAKAKEVKITNNGQPRGAFVQAKHVTFYVGPVPVFYTPYWQRHIGEGIFTTVMGYSGNYGAFIKVGATLHPTEWLTSKTHFDVYSERGIGLGQDFAWKTPRGGGEIRMYYIDDSDPQNENDMRSYRDQVDSQRYRIRLTDREQINRETYFATKLNWLSDPLITRDFFNTEYKNEANPENYAIVQHSAEDHAASLRVDHRLNDFYTTVNRMPELTYDKYRSRLGDSPFHFESQNNLSFLEMQNSKTNSPALNDYRAGRFDTYNQLFLPLRFKDFFNVIPRAGYRGTAYSDTETGGADYRSIFELGTLTAFKSYKTLTDKSGFYGDGLRHVVEPYADYSWRPKPNLTPEDLPQFDSIDAIDEQNEVRFGVRNLLQTKRGENRIANFLDSDVYTIYRFDPKTGEKSFSNLVADAEMRLTDNFFIQSDIEYNWYSHLMSPANARLKYTADDESEYRFEYRYLDGVRSLYTPSVKLFPNDKWSYEMSASYDQTYGQWYERKIMINHKFDCLGMGVGFKIDEYDDVQFQIQFWLLAFPKETVDTGF
jgi:LPS-assembly protein